MTTRLEPVWRTVPVEPTEAMFAAALATNEPFHPCAVWDAMLAAAPAPDGMREAIARVVQQEAEVIHNAGRRSKMYDSGALTDAILAIIAKGEGR